MTGAWWLRVGCAAYRLVLAVLPVDFGRRYREEMMNAFHRRSLRERRRGWLALGGFWIRAFGEGVAVAIRVRRSGHGVVVRPAQAPARRLSALGRDAQFALRAAWRRPAVPIAVIATMALGIGATTIAFSVIHGVLLRPLPYPEPDRLVRLIGYNVESGVEFGAVNQDDVDDWSQQVAELEAAVYTGTSVTLTGIGGPERVRGGVVSARFFDVLGTRAILGRVFSLDDALSTSDPVVMLSHGFWQRRFGGSNDVLGRRIRLNDEPHTIVGVLPSTRYQVPSNDHELWLPLRIAPDSWQFGRGPSWLSAIGRLAPGVDIAAAQTAVDVVTARLAEAYPETNARRAARVRSFHATLVASARPLLLLLGGTVGVVLLLGCSSVANLLLARAADRRREFALRAALGASRGRLVRQLLVEGMVLTVAGGAGGVGLAVVGLDVVLSLAGDSIPRQAEIGINVSVLVFTAVVSLVTGVAFGLVPAVRVARVELTSDIKDGALWSESGAGVLRLREAIVGIQVVLSVMLLIGAVLFGKSLWLLASVDPGFRSPGIATFAVTPPAARYPSTDDVVRLYDRILGALDAVPGVQATAVADRVPLEAGTWTDFFAIGGSPAPAPGREPSADFRRVTPNYFGVLGVPVRRGRAFGAPDDAHAVPVVIVNEALAERYVAGDPIGRTLRYGENEAAIVGVVANVRHRDVDELPMPTVYFPWAQSTGRGATVMVRADGNGSTVASAVRAQVRSVDADLAISGFVTMDERLAMVMGPPRFRALLVGGLAAVACILSVVGVYGVVAYTVRQRFREIGIRVALGSGTGAVTWLVVRQAMVVGAVAVGIGSLLSLGTTRIFRAFLFDVSATDPLVLVLAPVAFLLLIGAASFGPARKAARIDPLDALRSD